MSDVPQARERRPGVYWPEDIKAAVDGAYAQGRAAERQRIRDLSRRLDAEYPDYWGNPAKFADQIGDSDDN